MKERQIMSFDPTGIESYSSVEAWGERRITDPYAGQSEHPLPRVSWWKRMPLEAVIMGGASFVLLAAMLFAPVVF